MTTRQVAKMLVNEVAQLEAREERHGLPVLRQPDRDWRREVEARNEWVTRTWGDDEQALDALIALGAQVLVAVQVVFDQQVCRVENGRETA